MQAGGPHGTGGERIWLRRELIPIGAAVLLSLAVCANLCAGSPPGELLSVTNNPGGNFGEGFCPIETAAGWINLDAYPNVNYREFGGVWYQPFYSGSEIIYQTVPNPTG
jgi:hypothetical protein